MRVAFGKMKRIWISIGLVVSFSMTGLTRDIPAGDPVQNVPPQRPSSSEKSGGQPNLDGVVEVSFRVDGQGKVQIVRINSTSPQLADYVIRKLEKVRLEQGSSDTGKIIKYNFVFKRQA